MVGDSTARRTIIGPAGAPIEYELIEPAGIPKAHLLFIMGAGNHRTLWEKQRQFFASTYAMMFVDNRGIGRSAEVPGIWTISDLADDALFVLQNAAAHWASRPVHLVGHSMGALVCYEMIHRAPAGRIASLAMILSRLCGALSLRWSGICSFIALATSCSVEDIIKNNLAMNYPQEWLERSPAFDGSRGSNADAALQVLVRTLAGRERIPVSTLMKQALCYVRYKPSDPLTLPFKGRVLVIGGDCDSFHTTAGMRETATRLGGTFVNLAGGVGHNAIIQAADRVNVALERHFTDVAGDAGDALINQSREGGASYMYQVHVPPVPAPVPRYYRYRPVLLA